MSIDLLRSRSSLRRLTAIRVDLAQQAIEQGIANLSEVARYLGRDPSTLSKQLSRRQQEAEQPK